MNRTTKTHKIAKGLKKTQSKCELHEFSLRPCQEYMSHALNLNMSYCLSSGKKGSKNLQPKCLDSPCFNHDGNHATPTFILNSQKGYYSERGSKIREEQEQKMLDYTDQKSSLNVPKPRSKSSYCSVCRMTYEDYLEHIEGPLHRKRISQSQFNRHIIELTHRYPKNERQEQREWRSVEVKMENQQPTQIDSDEVQIIQNPNQQIRANERMAEQQRPQTMVGPQLSQPSFFRSFSSIYQDQMNQFSLNYSMNMNMFMSPYFNYPPLQMQSFKPYMPFSYFPYAAPGYYPQNSPYSRPMSYIVIDQ